jgi:hypothetical protein
LSLSEAEIPDEPGLETLSLLTLGFNAGWATATSPLIKSSRQGV